MLFFLLVLLISSDLKSKITCNENEIYCKAECVLILLIHWTVSIYLGGRYRWKNRDLVEFAQSRTSLVNFLHFIKQYCSKIRQINIRRSFWDVRTNEGAGSFMCASSKSTAQATYTTNFFVLCRWILSKSCLWFSNKVSARLISLAFRQSGQGLILASTGTFVSFLLCSDGFLPGTAVFPSPQKSKFDLTCCDLIWFVISSSNCARLNSLRLRARTH